MAIESLSGNTINMSLSTKPVAKDKTSRHSKQAPAERRAADTIAFTNASQDFKTAIDGRGSGARDQ